MSDAGDLGGSSTPSSSISRSLLERVRADDAAAWERLVSIYAPLVLYWCRRWGLQDDDASDVFQEVFLAVATHIRDFRKKQPTDTFRGWLRTITTNKVLDHFRRRRRNPGGVGGSEAQECLNFLAAPLRADEASADDSRAERAVYQRALELVRGEFEPRTWQAFWKTAVEDSSVKDVAVELGMSPGAVRVAKSRVLHRLREELGELSD